jgi:flavin reductase (DIM6/NTAB) family NADH-FMN oxidoreductase RutF
MHGGFVRGSRCRLALNFARKGGAGKLAGILWDLARDVPRVPGTGGFLACEVANLVSGGDHIVVLDMAEWPRPSQCRR